MKKKQSGFSLLELFISFALGIVVVGALVTFYAANKTNYRNQQGLQQLQENARFAQYVLTTNLRMAGLEGCGNVSTLTPTILVSPATNAPFDVNTVITGAQGSSSSWNPALPSSLSGRVVTGTDVVMVRFASPASATVNTTMTNATSSLSLTPNAQLNIATNDILIVSDCETADIFTASSVASGGNTVVGHASPPNSSASLSKAYQTDAQVSDYQYYAYYIGDTGRTNSVGLPIYALMQQDVRGVNTEIVEGVQDMQITYGIDTDGNNAVDTYLTANAVQSGGYWDQVLTINIALLLYTTESVAQSPQAYTFNGNTITPTDNRLRQQWNVFVALRNRGS